MDKLERSFSRDHKGGQCKMDCTMDAQPSHVDRYRVACSQEVSLSPNLMLEIHARIRQGRLS